MSLLQIPLSVIALLAVSILFGAAIYDTVVLGPNFQAGGPEGLEHARLFMVAATPARLFRVLSPATQATLLLCAVVFWKMPTLRWSFICALAAILACDALTFAYAYPRLRVLFTAPLATAASELRRAANGWVYCSYARAALVAAAWGACLLACCKLQSPV